MQSNLFNNVKYCKSCDCVMDLTYDEEVCAVCKELALFSDVKEYIRENRVTEYDVAEHFQIPRRKVKKWIQERRIEYMSEELKSKLVSTHCVLCGSTIGYGTMCEMCRKRADKLITMKQRHDNGKIRSSRF